MDSVQGSDGITPASAQTGVVTLSGSGLLAELANVGGQVEIAVAKSGQNGQLKTLIAGSNITLVETATTIEIVSSGGGGATADGQENMPFVLANEPIPGLFFGSTPDGIFRSLGMIVHNAMTVTRLGVYFMQAGSGTFNLGLYDNTGTLLAGSSFKGPVTGVNEFTIPATAITSLDFYYVGMTSRLNGTQMRGITNALTGGPTPHAYTEEINGNAGTTMRGSFNINNASLGDALWCIIAS